MTAHRDNGDLLSSWKEISDYLGCDERTCRRWELTHKLPVHRMEGVPKSRVYAYKSELDSWRKEKLNGAHGENGGPRTDAIPGTRFEPELAPDRPGLRKIPIKRLFWLIPAAVAIFTAVLYLARSQPGEPADFKIEGSKLIVLDEKGNTLWPFDTKLENLYSEQQYRDRFQTRIPSQGGRFELPYIVMRDINGCGKKEVLFVPKREREYYEPGLICFNSAGKVLWPFKPGRELKFGEHTYSADYRIFGIEPYDINNDGLIEVFLITAHQPHSPSGLVLLNPAGQCLGEFINYGRISDLAYLDCDADGDKEVLIAGMNDEFGKGFTALFDYADISGSSPQGKEYECPSCGQGSEEYYLLMPRTDVDKIIKPDKVGIDQIHLLNNDRIELQTQVSHIFFELDYDFRVQDVKGSDGFRENHRELKAAGKIKSDLNDAYWNALRDGVLYWNGTEWTPTPSRNQTR